MYELNRIRLIGAGPRSARYNDVTMDLSAAGEPIARGTMYADVRRPSPSSLLYLDNGGGKTVLLKLLFSVLLPGRRNVLGGTSATLDEFVLTNDTAHIVFEWMHVETGALLITGKVFQHRGKSATNSSLLDEAWYTFRPTDELNLDTVPTTVDHRRRKLENYKAQLAELDNSNARLDFTWITEHGVWRAHLAAQGLDPDMYALQRSMNADEGEAANAFKFTSSRAFVQWLLTTVTADDDAAAVAERFEALAAKVAERATMLAERDFLEGATSGLEPIAEAHFEQQQAQRAVSHTRLRAGVLHASLNARADVVTSTHKQLEAEVAEADASQQTLDTDRDNARDLLNEVNLQTLLLASRDADTHYTKVSRELEVREDEATAWSVVPLVADEHAYRAQMGTAADALTAAHEQARPLLRHRDRAATALAARLHLDAHNGDETAERHTRDAAGHEQDLKDLDVRVADANRSSASAETRRTVAQDTQRIATITLAASVTAKLVPEGTTAAAVPALVTEAETIVETTRQSRDTARTQRKALNNAATESDKAAQLARAAAATRSTEAAAAATELQAAERAASALAQLPAVLDVVGTDDGAPLTPAQFDADAATMTAALNNVTSHLDTELTDLRVDQARDHRVLTALGNGGLLPARDEVTAVIDTLAGANITAYAGWKFLADAVDPAQHRRIIDTYPELVDGVVLAQASDRDRAAEHLAAADLLPAAAIAVGPSALLDNPRVDDHTISVVEPSPAMYDAAAADQRRTEVQTAQDLRAQTIAGRATRVRDVSDAISQIEAWRRQHPQGHLEQAARNSEDLLEAAQRAAEADAAAGQEADRAAGERDQAAEDAERLGDELLAASRTLEALNKLAATQRASLEARAVIAAADVAITDAKAELQLAEQEIATARERLNTSRTAAADARRAATVARHRITELENTGTDQQAGPDTEQLDRTTLEATYQAAQRNYQAQAPGDELRRQLDAATSNVRSADAQLKQRKSAVVTIARRLLDSPAGADRSLWEDRARDAHIDRDRAAESVRRAVGAQSTAGTLVEGARPPGGRSTWRALSLEWRPRDVAHGHSLRRSAATRHEAAQNQLTAAVERVEVLRGQHQVAVKAADDFAQQARILEAALQGAHRPDTDPFDLDAVPAYAGTPTEAADAVQSARDELVATAEQLSTAETVLRVALHELDRFVKQPRYENLTSQLRQILLALPGDAVAARAGEWARDAQNRHTSLVTDIEAADRHRGGLVEQLANLAQRALRTIDNAQRLSILPPTLASWGGRPFVRISYGRTDLPTITALVGDLIDRRALEHVSGRKTGRAVTGMGLLLEAVDASVPNGFKVSVLKPDAVLRDEHMPIEKMTSFSGGQELTAAIVLYCMLAALQANERGQERARHAGVLFLDNPIGRANAKYLLDIQHAVAAALGVQLIYTTGIGDDRAMAAFPLWVQLRNDADLRHGLKFISIAKEVRRALPAHDDPDADGQVTATRVFVKPPVTGAAGMAQPAR